MSHTPFLPIVDRGETVTRTGGHRLRSWATTVVALLSTVLGLLPSTSMVWPGSQVVCADVAVTVAVNPDHTPTAHLLDYRITAGHSHGPPVTINGSAADGHTYYVLAGNTPVLVHNSCGELHFPGSSIDDATQRQITDLVDIYDANGGRLPDYIARGGGPGHVFHNNQGLLPSKPDGYYSEADVWALQPNAAGTSATRGAERLVFGNGGEVYYTVDHYVTFIRLR